MKGEKDKLVIMKTLAQNWKGEVKNYDLENGD